MSAPLSVSRFSGYRMQILVMLIAAATLGFGYLTLGLYVPILVTEMHASVTAITTLFSAVSGVSMIFSFFSGVVSKRIGVKPMVAVGVAALLAGYLLLRFTGNLVMLYIAGGLIGIALSWAGIILVARVVTAWFVARRGLMLGLASASAGAGALVGSPIVSHIIAGSGWRTAAVVTLVIMAVLTVPSVIFLKAEPADVGQTALGAGDVDEPVGAAAPAGVLSGASRWSAWGLMLFLFFAACYQSAGVQPNVANALVEKGFDITFAGTSLAVIAAFVLIGNLAAGFVADRVGIHMAYVYPLVSAAAGFALLAFASSATSVVLFSLLFGLSGAVSGPVVTLMTLRVFGAEDFAVMIGRNDASTNLFAVITPIVIGLMHDGTGSYVLPLMVGVAIELAAIGAGWAAIAISDRRRAAAEPGRGLTREAV